MHAHHERLRDLARIRDASARLLVIVMTAYALKGDIEYCLQKDMDDYIAKPVNKQLLMKKLLRWLIDRPDGATPAHEATDSVEGLRMCSRASTRPASGNRSGGRDDLLRMVVDFKRSWRGLAADGKSLLSQITMLMGWIYTSLGIGCLRGKSGGAGTGDGYVRFIEGSERVSC
ncbi:hypothetical protein DL770_009884 [Monosporascus sp. CRB-9-2]|nr:hypothetical protein DL770_009884 [Monosporascus sp. CRB-9-2]